MVEISKSGSGEGLGWETGRGYSTRQHRARTLFKNVLIVTVCAEKRTDLECLVWWSVASLRSDRLC